MKKKASDANCDKGKWIFSNPSTARITILLLILAFVFFRTYSYGAGYSYPMHIDEWQHTAQIISIANGRINWNPYFGEPHRDLEIGFHLFWAPFAAALGENLFIRLYSILPAVFAVLSSIALFLLVKKISKSYWTAVFSVLFFASLKSSVNLLGIGFFTPMTMSFPLIYLFMLFFSEGVSEGSRKKFMISGLLFLLITAIHPPSAAILIIPALAHLILERKFIKSEKKLILALFIAGTVLSILAVILLKKPNTSFLSAVRGFFVFPLGWTGLEIKYFLPFLYSIPATILALIGLYSAFARPNERFIAEFAVFSTALTFLFNNYGFSVLAPYQRAIYYALIALVPLSATGLYEFMKFTGRKASEVLKAGKSASKIAGIIIVALVFLSVFSSRYDAVDSRKKYAEMVVYDNDYSALRFIRGQFQNKVVLTPVFMNSAVYPASLNLAQSLLPAQLGTFDRQEERIEDAISFYDSQKYGNCTGADSIIRKWNVEVVFSRYELKCPFNYEKIYEEGGFVYKVI